jgi:hypothetical protein
MNNKIYGCEIKGAKYVVILETLGWNFYKIVGDDTMNTTPTIGLNFKDCKLWEDEEVKNMGNRYLQLKSFLDVI